MRYLIVPVGESFFKVVDSYKDMEMVHVAVSYEEAEEWIAEIEDAYGDLL